MARRNAEAGEGGGDGFAVGGDGYVEGWREHAAALARAMEFDEEGFAIDRAGVRIDGVQLASFAPAPQMAARAPILLHEACEALPVIDQWPAEKRQSTHINLDSQRRSYGEVCEWQARIRATALWVTDGTRTVIRHEKMPWEYVIARSAVRHDGARFGGRIVEPEGADNYLAELAALMDVALVSEPGGRIIIVMDATSPPLAARKFASVTDRWRQGYYAGTWLDTLMRLLARQEVVVFLWRRSHTGDPFNEVADVAADAAAQADHVEPVPRMPLSHASLLLTAPSRSMSKWAAPLLGGVIAGRFEAVLERSQVHEPGSDLEPMSLPDDVQRSCNAVLAERSCFGDGKRLRGQVRAQLREECVCPFGCVGEDGLPARFTWWHAQMRCRECSLVELRAAWASDCDAAHEQLSDKLEGRIHRQTQLACEEARRPAQQKRTRGGGVRTRVVASGAPSEFVEVMVRRLVGGLVRSTGDEKHDRSKDARAAARAAVISGARLQQRAVEITSDREEWLRQTVRVTHLAAKYGELWRRRVAQGGPARAAALREAARVAALVAVQAVRAGAVSQLNRAAHVNREATAVEVRRLAWIGVAADGPGVATNELGRLYESAWVATHSRDGDGAPSAVGTAGWNARTGTYMRVAPDTGWSWRVLALARRWRLVAALRRQRRPPEWWRRYGATAFGRRFDARGVARPFARWVRRTTHEEATGMATWLLDQLTVVHVACAEAREQHGSSGGAGLIELEAAAAARWELSGKRAAMLRRRAVAWEEASAARLKAQAAGFKSYMAQGGAAVVGLSGNPLQPTGGAIYVDVGTRGGGKRRATGPQGGRVRAPAESEFRRGAAPNHLSQWRVDRVLEVRRVRDTRQQAAAANALSIRIRWHGLDTASGLPWHDSWLPLFDEAGCTVNSHLRVDVEAMEADKYGAKAPRRAAARPRAADNAARAAPQWTRSPIRFRGRRAARAPPSRSMDDDADGMTIHTCRVPHVMFMRRVLRDAVGDDGGEALTLGAGPSRWDPRGTLSARLEASDDDADTSSCAGSCYASELDGSCGGMGWSDDEELAASWAALRNRRHAEGHAQCDEGGRDADGG